jgi:penicillin-binding protein 1C
VIKSLTIRIIRADARKPPLPWWEGRKGRGKINIHPHPHPPPSKGEGNNGVSTPKGERKGLVPKYNYWNGLFFFLLLFFWGSDVSNALPTYEEVRQSYVKSDSLLLDRRGEILHELRTDKVRRRLDWTSIKNISPALKVAVVKAEDKRFYEHPGFDYKSMGAAVVKGLTSESLRGASTVTMQLASFLNRELQARKERRSIWQKGKQVIEAWEIEKGWSKQEILEAYLNLVTFRGELQGIAAASRGLFGKDPHGLDQSESLFLASLIRSPNASTSELIKRVSHLNKMMDWKIGEEEIHFKVRQIFLGPSLPRPREDLGPHVARQLLKGKPHGATVISTLDSSIQRFTLDRLVHHLLPLRIQNVKDGAVLVVENQTGNVLAYVSYSGEPLSSRFVDGVQAKRQAGSTLKPFLYGLAFDQRILTPASLLDDSPLDIAVLSGIYQPRNYDSQFKGLVTTRMALGSSLNVPAVKTLSLVGTEPFLNRLRQLGIKGLNESGDFYGPSLALGSADVSLWELTNAYRTLANEGTWSELHLTPGENRSAQTKRIFSKEASFLISDILSDREARSITFGLENPLSTRFWTAVKTGTSKDMRDNWCIGYSRKVTVGVWTGNFSGEPMWNVSGVTGAAPIWIEVMNYLHRNDSNIKREALASLVRREIEFPQNIAPSREEWFIRGTEPNSKDQGIGPFNPRIVYPPSGTVIALDPDIPLELQKVFFISQINEDDFRWVLNGVPMETVGKTIPWTPKAGKYFLTLADENEKILDYIYFEVRGSEVN